MDKKYEMPWCFRIRPKGKPKDPNRSDLPNQIAQLLVDSEGTINGALKRWSEFNDHIHEHVRNVYELTGEIPMMALYDLENGQYSDFDFEDKEHFEWAKIQVRKACEEYYYKKPKQ